MPRDMANARVYARRRRAELRARYGPRGACTVCGSTEKLVWDHVDPTTKSFGIGSAIASLYSAVRIETELLKCRVLCARCNGSLTRQRRLTTAEVQAIRGAPGTHALIARRFGVTQPTVTKIKRGVRRTCPA